MTIADAGAANHGDPGAEQKQLSADRIRTIDQIKRLYAVVMGFAVTTSISNVYNAVKSSGFDPSVSFVILSDEFAFISLIVLFFLGTERFYDARYLRPDSRPASLRGLFLDLSASGISAGFFVILAETFSLQDPGTALDLPHVMAMQHEFFRNLLGLYAIDLVLLFVQIWRMRRHPTGLENSFTAHWIWVALNVATFLIFFFFHRDELGHVAIGFLSLDLLISSLALEILAIHAVRFGLDMSLTFEFYYPGAVNPAGDLMRRLGRRQHR